jgi:hypothetical protein
MAEKEILMLRRRDIDACLDAQKAEVRDEGERR